jgi:hypothetical protein
MTKLNELSKDAVFTHYEIHGVRLDQDDDVFEQVDDGEAEFFSLYGHIPGEGYQCIGDFKSREVAETVYARITGRRYTIPNNVVDAAKQPLPCITRPVPPRVVASLNTIRDYLWEDEARHFAETAETEEFAEDPMHIFKSLQVLRSWLAASTAEETEASGSKPGSTKED